MVIKDPNRLDLHSLKYFTLQFEFPSAARHKMADLNVIGFWIFPRFVQSDRVRAS
jgi:hypothetical protein